MEGVHAGACDLCPAVDVVVAHPSVPKECWLTKANYEKVAYRWSRALDDSGGNALEYARKRAGEPHQDCKWVV